MNTSTVQTATVPNASTARPFYARVAALGFVVIALAGLVAIVIGLLAGETDALSFALPIVIIGLLIAGAAWRFGAWAQILAALFAFLLLALLLPFSFFELLHPESAGDFIPVLFFAVGAGLGLIGAIVNLVQRRRHALRALATPTEALALKVLLAVVALVAVASVVMTVSARTTVTAESRAGALSIEQKNFQFTPGYIQAKAGQTIRVVVKNDDTTLHTFTLDQAGVNVTIPPGAERLIEFQAPASGAYQWYCVPHSQPSASGRTGMIGTLQVQ